MEQELFKKENKRIQSELQERVLQYLFSNRQTYLKNNKLESP